MKKLMFLLVSLVAITATAQVKSAAAAARKQIFAPRTMVYPAIRSIPNYPRYVPTTVLSQRQLISSQTRVAPIILASNESTGIQGENISQNIIPVETYMPLTALEENKIKTNEPKNDVNWAMIIFISGAVFLICWGIFVIWKKVRFTEKNNDELVGYSQAVESNECSCLIVLANGGGVLVRG